MSIELTLEDNIIELDGGFADVQQISDGGYDVGYEAGYKEGELDGRIAGVENGFRRGYERGRQEGYSAGYGDGLAARTYETWTITYVDGTVEEKEVALL